MMPRPRIITIDRHSSSSMMTSLSWRVLSRSISAVSSSVGAPVCREPLQEVGIGEPDAALVLLREQVAIQVTGGRLVGVNADEAGNHGRGGNPVLGKHALDLPATRTVRRGLVGHTLRPGSGVTSRPKFRT